MATKFREYGNNRQKLGLNLLTGKGQSKEQCKASPIKHGYHETGLWNPKDGNEENTGQDCSYTTTQSPAKGIGFKADFFAEELLSRTRFKEEKRIELDDLGMFIWLRKPAKPPR